MIHTAIIALFTSFGFWSVGALSDTSEKRKWHLQAPIIVRSSIVPLSKAGSPKVMRFSTSGLDGKIAIWDLENMQEELGHQL